MENRATQDTFQSLKVNFFCHFYIPFFFVFLRPKKLQIQTLKSVPGSLYFPLLSFFISTLLSTTLSSYFTNSEQVIVILLTLNKSKK